MPLLLSQDDLDALFTQDTFYAEIFDVIRESLLRQRDESPGVVSWVAFPTAQERQQINFHFLTTPVEGTSVRVFPHRVGAQARDSMFTLLFDDTDGHLLALISLDDLGPLRTSAPVAFACQYLAPQQANTLALIGSGLQARYHLQGIRAASPSLEWVRVYSPTPENRKGFAVQMQAELDLRVEAVESIQEAIDGADIVAVTAGNYLPIAALEGVRPGALVTSIVGRSIPGDLYARSRLVVPALVGPDHHASGWGPFPFRLNGGLDPSMVGTTLVDILRGKDVARQREDDIVIYEQSGSFAWDGGMTRWLYDWAVEHKVGSTFHISAVPKQPQA